ncbi:hypothetical protein ACH4VR_19955 [Streptomyces sp. NPDC020883]
MTAPFLPDTPRNRESLAAAWLRMLELGFTAPAWDKDVRAALTA